MRIFHISLYPMLIPVLLLLGGCASTGTIQTTMPLTEQLSNYKTVLFHVSSQDPQAAEEIIQLESLTIAKLRQTGLFEKVISGSASPDARTDLRIRARIIKLKEVTAGERVMLGAFAGQGEAVVVVELIDIKSGKHVGKFTAEGKSSGGTIFAGTHEQAIERVSEQIVQFVQNNV